MDLDYNEIEKLQSDIPKQAALYDVHLHNKLIKYRKLIFDFKLFDVNQKRVYDGGIESKRIAVYGLSSLPNHLYNLYQVPNVFKSITPAVNVCLHYSFSFLCIFVIKHL